MPISKKQAVLAYLQEYETCPLIFVGNYTKGAQEKYANLIRTVPLQEAVVHTILAAENANSVRQGTSISETYTGRWRSSLDIWRHIKSVRPETTIFEVLNALYELSRRKYTFAELTPHLCGQYCSTVNRRTFKWLVNCSLYDQDEHDEYGLTLRQWKFPEEKQE